MLKTAAKSSSREAMADDSDRIAARVDATVAAGGSPALSRVWPPSIGDRYCSMPGPT
jgi:hypothetical protein